ncbi:MAG TPA: alpha/beta hydrolase [Pyrinomonadaceae bacterium]|jgi:pimeloyl-ACP methyl ester carboxylesterase|nr:alpha/beta hydrolase [Pyrinomonadaceae bacterium]
MNLNDWKESGKYFESDGLSVFYHLTEKADEVLLCLHGFPASSFDYHKIWNELAKEFAVLSFDLVGYGFSAKPPGFDYTTADQVDVLQKLLEHLEIRRVHILAHDYGNTITQELLARDSEKRLNFSILSICMLNGALFPETHRPILAQKILISPLGFLFGKLISDRVFKRSLASVFGANTQPTAAELEDFAYLFKYNKGKRIAHKLIRYMTERAKFRARWTGALETMKPPFRMINGSADKVSGAHLVKRFREVVPFQTDLIELENIGHFPHLEAPEIVLDKFFEFQHKNR